MDHRKLVQQRLGEPGRVARGGRRQERGQRGAVGGEGGGLREPCLKIPFHRQEFISWGLIALELLTAVSPTHPPPTPPGTPDCLGKECPPPCPTVLGTALSKHWKNGSELGGWPRGLPGIPHLMGLLPLERGLE